LYIFIYDVPRRKYPNHWQTSTGNFLETVSFFALTLEIQPEHKDFVRWYSPGFCEIEDTTHEGWYIGHFYMDSLELAASFVVGLGHKVKIIEPVELQELVKDKIQTLIKGSPMG
jgi:hypothetical protein